jgi:hypothetical protein
MSPRQIKIFNGRMITPHRVIDNAAVLITGDKITVLQLFQICKSIIEFIMFLQIWKSFEA